METIIRSRAPLRIGLAGGGSDVSPFCDIYGGKVINAAINKYAYCSIKIIENENTVGFISHDIRRAGYICGGIVIHGIEKMLPLHVAVYYYFVDRGLLDKSVAFIMTTWTDVPYGSGLGASSAIVVAMIAAYCELTGMKFTKKVIAEIAIEIERNILKLPGGKQDQCSASFGGWVNYIEFENRHFQIRRLNVDEKVKHELEMSMILCYTGTFRDSDSVMLDQIEKVKSCDTKSIDATKVLVEYVPLVEQALKLGSIQKFAQCINASYFEKEKIAENIVNSKIAQMRYDFMNEGALACKICGAGNGGFMLLIVDPLSKEKFKRMDQYKNNLWMEFQFVYEGVQSWKL